MNNSDIWSNPDFMTICLLLEEYRQLFFRSVNKKADVKSDGEDHNDTYTSFYESHSMGVTGNIIVEPKTSRKFDARIGFGFLSFDPLTFTQGLLSGTSPSPFEVSTINNHMDEWITMDCIQKDPISLLPYIFAKSKSSGPSTKPSYNIGSYRIFNEQVYSVLNNTTPIHATRSDRHPVSALDRLLTDLMCLLVPESSPTLDTWQHHLREIIDDNLESFIFDDFYDLYISQFADAQDVGPCVDLSRRFNPLYGSLFELGNGQLYGNSLISLLNLAISPVMAKSRSISQHPISYCELLSETLLSSNSLPPLRELSISGKPVVDPLSKKKRPYHRKYKSKKRNKSNSKKQSTSSIEDVGTSKSSGVNDGDDVGEGEGDDVGEGEGDDVGVGGDDSGGEMNDQIHDISSSTAVISLTTTTHLSPSSLYNCLSLYETNSILDILPSGVDVVNVHRDFHSLSIPWKLRLIRIVCEMTLQKEIEEKKIEPISQVKSAGCSFNNGTSKYWIWTQAKGRSPLVHLYHEVCDNYFDHDYDSDNDSDGGNGDGDEEVKVDKKKNKVENWWGMAMKSHISSGNSTIPKKTEKNQEKTKSNNSEKSQIDFFTSNPLDVLKTQFSSSSNFLFSPVCMSFEELGGFIQAIQDKDIVSSVEEEESVEDEGDGNSVTSLENCADKEKNNISSNGDNDRSLHTTESSLKPSHNTSVKTSTGVSGISSSTDEDLKKYFPEFFGEKNSLSVDEYWSYHIPCSVEDREILLSVLEPSYATLDRYIARRKRSRGLTGSWLGKVNSQYTNNQGIKRFASTLESIQNQSKDREARRMEREKERRERDSIYDFFVHLDNKNKDTNGSGSGSGSSDKNTESCLNTKSYLSDSEED